MKLRIWKKLTKGKEEHRGIINVHNNTGMNENRQ